MVELAEGSVFLLTAPQTTRISSMQHGGKGAEADECAIQGSLCLPVALKAAYVSCGWAGRERLPFRAGHMTLPELREAARQCVIRRKEK